jgi:hypothetical protein
MHVFEFYGRAKAFSFVFFEVHILEVRFRNLLHAL